MYGTSDHEGSTGVFEQSMTYKFGRKIEDVEGRPNEFLELVRRYDEANGTDPVPDQVKRACIISSTTEPLKTHLQLNVSKVGTFDALRVATEDYLRSRRIFKTTSAGNTHEDDPMEVDVLSRKGKGKENSGNGKKCGKKSEEGHTGKGYGESKVDHTRFDGGCRNCGEHSHKAVDLLVQAAAQNLKAKVKVQASQNPTSQKSVKATRANRQKRRGHQTHLCNRHVCAK